MQAGKAAVIRVVADRAIPHVEDLCSPWCRIKSLAATDITHDALTGADALLVRTVTDVNIELLANTRVQFVGSATAGSDHIDLQGLREAGVSVACAPGCNANAVVDYVLAAIFMHIDAAVLAEKTVGIFGYGNVGRRLVAVLDLLGIKTRVYDPLLALDEMSLPACAEVAHGAEQVLSADVVSLHVPLTHSGAHATRHLLGAGELGQLQPGGLLINTSRGGVVDNRALLAYLQRGGRARIVLDVWEGEPAPLPALVARVALATPHIAGYSVAAKIRATHTVVAAMRAFFAHADQSMRRHSLPEPSTLRESVRALGGKPGITQFSQQVQTLCQLDTLSADFKQLIADAGNNLAEHFTQLRADYRLRDEHNYSALMPARTLANSFLTDGN
ncbi:MAG: 4-phosphoerythronate dehydrogenase [Pseudomonadales bacterium]